MKPLVVVGRGRVGSVFVRVATEAGHDVRVVGRDDSFDGVATGTPIVVCTRPDDLADVLARVPPALRDDLVFVQNGWILPLLHAHGVTRPTLGLVYFAATSRDGTCVAGAPSLFYGPHAADVVALLEGAGIPARVVPDADTFAWETAVKLSWNIVFGLLGDHFDAPVGVVATRHRATVDALCAEVAAVFSALLGRPLPAEALADRLVAYSLGIPDFRASVKEPRWRNGWLAETAARHHVAIPLHETLRVTGT